MVSVRDYVKEYVNASAFDVFDNANKYFSPTGLFNYIMEKSMRSLVEQELPRDVYEAHVKGYIYVHKLPYSLFVPYCCGHSIRRFLIKGLKTPTIYSRPARHFNTYIDHIVNYLCSMQQYFSGAQSLNMVELYSGPFIRNDKLDYGSVRQEIQRMLFNLNFPSRVGMQTPFTNFTIALDAPHRMLKEDRAVYDGRDAEPLGTYLDEAALFVRALAENYSIGDGHGAPFTFPISTIMTTSKLLYEDPELFEAVFKAAAKYGSFYWLNTRVVNPDTSFAMCCRINIDRKLLLEFKIPKSDLEASREEVIKAIEETRSGGLWALPDITGSIGVITINLPRIAYESRGDDTRFYEKLDHILDIVRKGLEWMRYRYYKLARSYPNIYQMPLEYIPEVYRLTGSPFFNTIGVIGLPEAAAIMIGDERLWVEPSARSLGRAIDIMIKIVRYIVDKARRWGVETGMPYNVEEVPGETAAVKLAEKDARLYPEIRKYIPLNDALVYSSSIAPYYANLDLMERIYVESRVQKYFTGGVMMHIFLGEEPDPEALAKLVKRLTNHTELVYWSFTPAITVCRKCGWRFVGAYIKCPRCGSETEIWSRIIGYYRPLKNWNIVRRREFWSRRHY